MSSARNSIKEERDVNNERLINEVHKYRTLWDQAYSEYKKRSIKVKHWEAVASELNQTVDEVKNRWKLLKDSFNRELRNVVKNGSNSKWIHFDQMSFLLKGTSRLLWPQINGDVKSDSGYPSHSPIETDSEIHNASNSCDNELSENSFHKELELLPPKNKKHKSYHLPSRNSVEMANSIQMNSQTDGTKSASFHTKHTNEDYHFLMSLLPSLERLSPKQKVQLKIKLLKDIYEVTFEPDTCLNCSNNENNLMN